MADNLMIPAQEKAAIAQIWASLLYMFLLKQGNKLF
jgi:hypothetical protein